MLSAILSGEIEGAIWVFDVVSLRMGAAPLTAPNAIATRLDTTVLSSFAGPVFGCLFGSLSMGSVATVAHSSNGGVRCDGFGGEGARVALAFERPLDQAEVSRQQPSGAGTRGRPLPGGSGPGAAFG